MKNLLSILIITLGVFSISAQDSNSSINSGAVSNNSIIYSVGEIFVNPIDPNQANSGLIGTISRIEFFVGIDQIISSDDLKVYPNPTSNNLFFEWDGQYNIEQVFVYDTQGKLVLTQTVSTSNTVNLSELPNGLYLIRTNIQNLKALKITKQSI
jgi:hypothetical protein